MAKNRKIRWGVEKRLEFIEFRLFWEGGINRSDIMERFGVSVPQASKDLSLYEERAPGNLVYDRREKRYFASPGFKPVFLKPDADRYLTQLRSFPIALCHRTRHCCRTCHPLMRCPFRTAAST